MVRITVFFPEWNSVTRLSVIVVAIVFVGIVSCAVTFTTAAVVDVVLVVVVVAAACLSIHKFGRRVFIFISISRVCTSFAQYKRLQCFPMNIFSRCNLYTANGETSQCWSVRFSI